MRFGDKRIVSINRRDAAEGELNEKKQCELFAHYKFYDFANAGTMVEKSPASCWQSRRNAKKILERN